MSFGVYNMPLGVYVIGISVQLQGSMSEGVLSWHQDNFSTYHPRRVLFLSQTTGNRCLSETACTLYSGLI